MPSSRRGSHSLTLMTVGGKPRDVVDLREARPGEGIARLEGLDAVAHRAAVVVQAEQDALVLDARGGVGGGPLPGDVGAQRVEALDEAEVAVALEGEAGGQGEVPATALAGDDDPSGIDAEVVGVRTRPSADPDKQSLSPAGKGATSGADEGTTQLRKSGITTATPLAAMIRPQARYMP